MMEQEVGCCVMIVVRIRNRGILVYFSGSSCRRVCLRRTVRGRRVSEALLAKRKAGATVEGGRQRIGALLGWKAEGWKNATMFCVCGRGPRKSRAHNIRAGAGPGAGARERGAGAAVEMFGKERR